MTTSVLTKYGRTQVMAMPGSRRISRASPVVKRSVPILVTP
jgi:hypothetical protein